MHEVFQLLKMLNCFDGKRKDVTEKRGECLKHNGSHSSSCVVQLTRARFKVFVAVPVRGRAEFDPSAGRCHSSSDAAAGCPSLLCVLHIPGLKTHIRISLSEVEAYDRRWENLRNIYMFKI